MFWYGRVGSVQHLRHRREVVLTVRVDLQRVVEAEFVGGLQPGLHRRAFAAVGLTPQDQCPVLQPIEHPARRWAARVVHHDHLGVFTCGPHDTSDGCRLAERGDQDRYARSVHSNSFPASFAEARRFPSTFDSASGDTAPSGQGRSASR